MYTPLRLFLCLLWILFCARVLAGSTTQLKVLYAAPDALSNSSGLLAAAGAAITVANAALAGRGSPFSLQLVSAQLPPAGSPQLATFSLFCRGLIGSSPAPVAVLSTGDAQALALQAESLSGAGVPLLAPIPVAADLFAGASSRTLVRLHPDEAQVAGAVADTVRLLGFTEVSLVVEDSAQGVRGQSILLSALTANGIDVQEKVYRVPTGGGPAAAAAALAPLGAAASSGRFPLVALLWASDAAAPLLLAAAVSAGAFSPTCTWISSSAALPPASQVPPSALVGLLALAPSAVALSASAAASAAASTAVQQLLGAWPTFPPPSGPFPLSPLQVLIAEAVLYVGGAVSLLPPAVANASAAAGRVTWAGMGTLAGLSDCQNAALFAATSALSPVLPLLPLGPGVPAFPALTAPAAPLAAASPGSGPGGLVRSSYSLALLNMDATLLALVPRLLYDTSSKTFGSRTGIGGLANMTFTWANGVTSSTPPGDVGTLRGAVLKILAPLQNPFVMQAASGELTGYSIDILKALAAALGFTYSIDIAPSSMTYNQIVGTVATGEYDMVVGDVTITQARLLTVDFTVSNFDNSIRVATRRPTPKPLALLAFLTPFSWDVWLTWAGCIVLSAALNAFYEGNHGLNGEFANPNMPKSKHHHHPVYNILKQLGQAVYFVTNASLGGGFRFDPLKAASKASTLMVMFTSMIVLATYTGSIASALTVASYSSHLESLDQIKSGEFPAARLGVKPGNANEPYIRTYVTTAYYVRARARWSCHHPPLPPPLLHLMCNTPPQ